MKYLLNKDNVEIRKLPWNFKKDCTGFLYTASIELNFKHKPLFILPKKIFKYEIFKNTDISLFQKYEKINIDARPKSLAIFLKREKLSRKSLLKLIKSGFRSEVYFKYNTLKFHSSPLGNKYIPDLKYYKILKTDWLLEEKIIKILSKRMAYPSTFRVKLEDLFKIKSILDSNKVNLYIFDNNADFNKGARLIIIDNMTIEKNLASKILEKRHLDLNILGDYLYFNYFNDFYIMKNEFIEKHLEELLNIALEKDISKLKKELKIVNGIKPIENKKIADKAESLILAKLFPLQRVGVSWIYEHYLKSSGALLADEMGSGKTIQTLAFLALIEKDLKKNSVLIITPAIIVDVWKNEIKKFAPQLADKCNIMSFQKFLADTTSECSVLIIDETQNLKNKGTKSYEKIDNIKRKFTLLLSGTPIENKSDDLQNIIRLINPIFGNFFAIINRISKNESVKVNKILEVIRPYILARKVSKKQLKTKLIQKVIKIKPDPKYNEILLNKKVKEYYGNDILKAKSKNSLEYYNAVIIALMKARQVVSMPALLKNAPKFISAYAPNTQSSSKMDKLLKLINEVDSYNIIFTLFTESAIDISKKLNCPIIIGSTTRKKREEIIQEYQKGMHKNIVIALKAGNAGITLTQATKVFFYDLWWNPAVLAQAAARAYRIGQTQNVEVYYLILENSIDELIMEIIESKKEIIDTYKDNVDKPQLNKDTSISDLNKLRKFF